MSFSWFAYCLIKYTCRMEVPKTSRFICPPNKPIKEILIAYIFPSTFYLRDTDFVQLQS